MLGGVATRPGWEYAAFRRLLVVLIGIGAATAVAAVPPRLLAFGGDAAPLEWGLPAAAAGLLVSAILLSASASPDSLAFIAARGLPVLPVGVRAASNGLVWAGIAMLGTAFTAPAFDLLPGGSLVAGALLGAGLAALTGRLHRTAIAHESYRTFNLVAMLLAVGSLASMSITPTGDWWTINFSTLGTSDDVAAACFNVAIVIAGLGMAALGPALSRDLVERRFAPRPGGAVVLRVLIAVIGVSLAGVGLVPIDDDPLVHNAFACSAAGAFALATIGMAWWVRRPPKRFLVWSYASLAVEVAAMIGYDGLDLYNLTVFEIVAFSLVFAWLIAMVATTAAHPHPSRERSRRRWRDGDRSGRRMPRSAYARPPMAAAGVRRPPVRVHAGTRHRRRIRPRALRARPSRRAEEPPEPWSSRGDLFEVAVPKAPFRGGWRSSMGDDWWWGFGSDRGERHERHRAKRRAAPV